MKIYITFGSKHNYNINDKILGINHTAIVNVETHQEARKIAFKLFGGRFCTTYTEYDGSKWGDVPVELTAHDIAVGYKERFSVMKAAVDRNITALNIATNGMIDKQRELMTNIEAYIDALEKEQNND